VSVKVTPKNPLLRWPRFPAWLQFVVAYALFGWGLPGAFLFGDHGDLPLIILIPDLVAHAVGAVWVVWGHFLLLDLVSEAQRIWREQ
jgi:hypothetical protein